MGHAGIILKNPFTPSIVALKLVDKSKNKSAHWKEQGLKHVSTNSCCFHMSRSVHNGPYCVYLTL